MKSSLIVVGRVRAPFVEADAHYRKLLSRYLPLDVIEVRDDGELDRRIPLETRIVALDAGGRELDSHAWSAWLSERRFEARDICFMIGGAKGLPAAVLARASERISLGRQTMAHQLVRVALLEQLFRAAKIEAGEPYHH